MRLGIVANLGRRWAAGFVDLLFPRVCGACRAAPVDADHLCEPCSRKLLEMVSSAYCIRCGSGLGPNVPSRPDGCVACGPVLPRFSRVVRLGSYAGPLKQAVRAIKYRRHEGLRKHLGSLLAAAVTAQFLEAAETSKDIPHQLDLVLSVPMHWRRRFDRGYDHARALAGTLSRELGVELGSELVREHATPPQAHLSRTRRIQNVRGDFEVRAPHLVDGRHVLLVDDVTTTGATANEATRALLKAGARSVVLAVLAKSEPPRAYATPTT